MFHRFNRSTVAGYLGLSVVVSTSIFQDMALAESEKQMICDGAASYVNRRLDSEQNGNPRQVYKALAEATGKDPRWIFHNDLIDRRGNFAGSFGGRIDPQSTRMTRDIERLF